MKLIRESFTWDQLEVLPGNVEVSHKLKKYETVDSMPWQKHLIFFMEKDQDSLVRGHANYLGPHHAEIIESFTKWILCSI